MNGPMKVALVGCGAHARESLAPAILACPVLRLAALVDPDPGALALIRPAPPAYPTIEDLAASGDEIDAVVIAVPPARHIATASAALAAGWHVLLEKPCGELAAALADLMDQADTAGLVLESTYQYRRQASWALAALDRIGPIRSASAFWLRPATSPGGGLPPPSAWNGRGVGADLGSHLLSLILPPLGPVASVWAHASHYAGQLVTGRMIPAEAEYMATIDTATARATIHAAWSIAVPVERCDVEMWGERGGIRTAIWTGGDDPPRPVLAMRDGTTEVGPELEHPETALRRVVFAWADACRSADRQHVAPPGLALDILRCLDAGYRSIATGRPVSLGGDTHESQEDR